MPTEQEKRMAIENIRRWCTENRKSAMAIYDKIKHAEDEFMMWFAKSCLYSVQCYTHIHNLNEKKYEAPYKRLTSALAELICAMEEYVEKGLLQEAEYIKCVDGLKSRKEGIEETGCTLTEEHLWESP